MATKSRCAKRHESLALSLQRRHSLISLKPRSRTDVEVHPVLGDLVVGHLLEEHPWPLPVRILDRRPGIPLIGRHPYALEKVVPGFQWVSAFWYGDTRRTGVDIAQRIAPERRQGSWITGIKRDLKVVAHSLIMAASLQRVGELRGCDGAGGTTATVNQDPPTLPRVRSIVGLRCQLGQAPHRPASAVRATLSADANASFHA